MYVQKQEFLYSNFLFLLLSIVYLTHMLRHTAVAPPFNPPTIINTAVMIPFLVLQGWK